MTDPISINHNVLLKAIGYEDRTLSISSASSFHVHVSREEIYYSGEKGCAQDQICDILFMAMVCLCVRLEGWGGEGELSSNAEHMGTLS